MKRVSLGIKDAAVMLMTLGVCFAFGLLIRGALGEERLIPAVFILGSFLTSILTEGYIFGVISALLSVLAVNYAFTFPFFRFNFTIPENLVSAVIMIIVALITCGLTTKLKHQEAIKAESEKERMRANLLRSVSHDLRTPLTTICGASSALLEDEGVFTEKQRKEMLRSICMDAQWLSRMVENLLSVTRLDGGNVKIIKTPTVLEELVDSVLIKFKKRCPGCKIDVNLPHRLVIIPMDAILIEQVLINILENAVLHAKGMTRISLTVTELSGRVVFEIEDDGAGIEEERLPGLFSGIYAKEGQSDGQGRNAGIGLSVCSSIIKAHGSELHAENVRGGGALFRFSLCTEDADDE